jgi:hypothetical protein
MESGHFEYADHVTVSIVYTPEGGFPRNPRGSGQRNLRTGPGREEPHERRITEPLYPLNRDLAARDHCGVPPPQFRHWKERNRLSGERTTPPAPTTWTDNAASLWNTPTARAPRSPPVKVIIRLAQ